VRTRKLFKKTEALFGESFAVVEEGHKHEATRSQRKKFKHVTNLMTEKP